MTFLEYLQAELKKATLTSNGTEIRRLIDAITDKQDEIIEYLQEVY